MFDLGFLNAELERAGKVLVARERLVDTLLLARRKHPAGPNRLDDLCARYGIDNSRRTKHGALLDAEILAEVYLELIGARQAQLILVETGIAATGVPAPVPPSSGCGRSRSRHGSRRTSATRISPSWRRSGRMRSGGNICVGGDVGRQRLILGRAQLVGVVACGGCICAARC